MSVKILAVRYMCSYDRNVTSLSREQISELPVDINSLLEVTMISA